MDKYFIIQNSDDGIDVDMVDKEELLRRITPDKDGYTYYGETLKFLDYMPKVFDGYLESDGVIIVKGQIVVPQIKQVVTKYEI